jgi:hypothetical protein
MTNFENGRLKIESMSKGLEMAMKPSGIGPCADRADSAVCGRGKREALEYRENHPYLREQEIASAIPI